jgi:hypothetical protein
MLETLGSISITRKKDRNREREKERERDRERRKGKWRRIKGYMCFSLSLSSLCSPRV